MFGVLCGLPVASAAGFANTAFYPFMITLILIESGLFFLAKLALLFNHTIFKDLSRCLPGMIDTVGLLERKKLLNLLLLLLDRLILLLNLHLLLCYFILLLINHFLLDLNMLFQSVDFGPYLSDLFFIFLFVRFK